MQKFLICFILLSPLNEVQRYKKDFGRSDQKGSFPGFITLLYYRNCLIFDQTLEMEIKSMFETAVVESKSLSEKPSNETLLQLYSLFKQATEGDNTNESPSNPFDFVARAKHDAWAGLNGKTQELAMEEYISLVNKLKG
jgi:diazepam-binding inhibitor (GABA receptor modulator, acyl-CoA-binding protein)